MGQGAEDAGGYEIDYDPYYEGLEDGTWQQADHSSIRVADMSVSHIRNAIRLCEAKSKTETFSCESDKWQDWIDIFEEELASRGEPRYAPKANPVYNHPSKKQAVRGAKFSLRCHCGKVYAARVADVRRGWARSCCKSCAAKKRDFKLADPVCAKTGASIKQLLKKGT